MTTKEFLKQYEYADKYAQKLRKEYIKENELIDAVPLDTDGMPHGSNISKPTEEKAIKLSEAFKRWKAAEVDAIESRQKVFEYIKGIPGIEGDVLYERYINLHKWEEICVMLNYSWNGIHRIHRRALKMVEEGIEVYTT